MVRRPYFCKYLQMGISIHVNEPHQCQKLVGKATHMLKCLQNRFVPGYAEYMQNSSDFTQVEWRAELGLRKKDQTNTSGRQ